MAAWRLILTNLSGTPLGEVLNATDRRIFLPLNALPTLTLRMRLDNPLAGEITNPDPLVRAPGDVMLKAYRNESLTSTPNWVLRFFGDLTTAEEVGAEDGSYTLSCNFAGRLWRLTKRLYNRTLTELPATGEMGQVMWDLINDANQANNTGIKLGTLNTTQGTEAGPWRFKPVAEAISEVAATKAFSFEPTYLAQDGLAVATGALLAGGTNSATGVTSTARKAAKGGFWAEQGNISAGGLFPRQSFVGTGSAVKREFRYNLAGGEEGDIPDQGAFAYLSGTINGAVGVGANIRFNGITGPYAGRLGLLARFSDMNNWVMATVNPTATSTVTLRKSTTAGSVTQIATANTGALDGRLYGLRMQIDAAGNYRVWFWDSTTIGQPILSGQDTSLASGILADGKVGIYDEYGQTGTTAVVREVSSFAADRAYVAYDDFPVAELGDTERAAPLGGTWYKSVKAGGLSAAFRGYNGTAIKRTWASDARLDSGASAPGQALYLAPPISGPTYVQVDQMKTAQFNGMMGVFARFTGTSQDVPQSAFFDNFFLAAYDVQVGAVKVFKRTTGTGTVPTLVAQTGFIDAPHNTFHTIRLEIDADGNWAVWHWPTGTTDPGVPVLYGQDSGLTGSPLNNGRIGIYDENQSGAATRYYDSFKAAVPVNIPMGWQGVNFEVEPIEPETEFSTGHLKVAQFNAAPQIGTSKPNVIFEYGGGNRSVKSYRRVISREGLLNRAYSIVAASVEEDTNQPSIDARGLYEEVVATDVGEATLRKALMTAHVQARGTARHIVTFDPSAQAPRFGSSALGNDYIVGDYVTARAIVGTGPPGHTHSATCGHIRFNGTVRVYAVTISIDDEGREEVSPTLVDES